jgi:hypothetical protein
MPFTIITGDTFTSTGVGVKINMPSSADYVRVVNMTQLPLTPATPVVVISEWFGPRFGLGQSAANDGIRWKKSANTSVLNVDTFATATASNGFTYYTTSPNVEPQAPNAITGITNANPAVVTQTNTYSEGDFLRIYNTTGMLQLGGIVAQISSVTTSGYTLLGVPATASNGFAAAATAGNTRRVSKNAAVDPEYLYITNISQATNAVISTSVDPSNYYVVGNKIHLSVPSSFGMTQMNNVTATILAINAVSATANIGAYNITVDTNSSAFSAFVWPASSTSPTSALFATLSPAGSSTQFNPLTLVQTGYEFQKTPFHTGQFVPYLFLSGGAQSPAGANLDQINWMAYKLET